MNNRFDQKAKELDEHPVKCIRLDFYKISGKCCQLKGLKKSMKTFILLLLIFIFSTGVAPGANIYTLRPQWVPQAQFAGYYMAVEKGLYENAGINIEIKNGGPGLIGLQEILSGNIDFATGWLTSGLRMRGRGAELLLIGQFFQRPALMLIAKKEKNIDSIDKFTGHTLGVWPGDFQIPAKALFRKYKIRNVKVVNQAFSMDSFINGEIDIASAMKYNEYYQVLEAGVKKQDIVIFNYFELGLNLPEDGVYVHKDFWKKNPELCRKFIKASLEGWKYAFEHKTETIRLMTRLANETAFKTTEKKQRIMLDEVEKLIDLNSAKLKKEDFELAVESLKSTKILRIDIKYDSFTKF
ncbi:NitT/TauT family transport system substrate-binding protein [Candidatus Magnetomoraceae bacterium gMMP-1]